MALPVPTLIRGVLYPSIAAAARAHKVDPSVVWKAMENGKLSTVGRGKNARKPIIVDGIAYPSINAAARGSGIPFENLRRKALAEKKKEIK